MLTTTARFRGARAGFARAVELSFSDGTLRCFDVGPLLWGPVFSAIAEDSAAFTELFFDPRLGTVCWPNGADIAPETLLGLPDVGHA